MSGSVFVHELSECRPGAALDYLAAVREDWVPVLRDHGHTLVGLYEVLMTDTEVMTVWATDPEGHEPLGRAIDAGADDRIARWRARSRRVPHPLARGAHDAVPRHAPLPRRPALAAGAAARPPA